MGLTLSLLGLSSYTIGSILTIIPMMFAGSLATMDSHTKYKRTWYSKIKVQSAALGFALMSAVEISILNSQSHKWY